MGEPQRAYIDLDVSKADSFTELKKAILSRVGVTGPSKAQEFHEWRLVSHEPPRVQLAKLARLSKACLRLEENCAPRIVDHAQ